MSKTIAVVEEGGRTMTTAVAPVTQAPALPVVPYDVLELAGDMEVLPALYKNLKLVRRLFPGRSVHLSQERDPELRGVKYIVFRVDVEGWDADRRHTVYNQWVHEKIPCPDPEKEPFMSLAMES